jgi:hypothetical protein
MASHAAGTARYSVRTGYRIRLRDRYAQETERIVYGRNIVSRGPMYSGNRIEDDKIRNEERRHNNRK